MICMAVVLLVVMLKILNQLPGTQKAVMTMICQKMKDACTENHAKIKDNIKVNRAIDWYEVLQSYYPKKEMMVMFLEKK